MCGLSVYSLCFSVSGEIGTHLERVTETGGVLRTREDAWLFSICYC